METPQEWLARLPLVSPPPNRIVIKVRAAASRPWRILRTVPIDVEAVSADPDTMIDAIRRDLAGAEEVDAALLEAWTEGAKKRSDYVAWPAEELAGAEVESKHSIKIRSMEIQLEGNRLLLGMQRDYIRDLHAALAATHQHVPRFSKEVLEATIGIARRAEEDRERWQATTLALLASDHGGDSQRDRVKALAREDLHHAGRALVSAVAARFGVGGAPLAGPLLDALRELGSSLEKGQLEKLSTVLRPEQQAAFLAIMTAANGEPEALAPPAPEAEASSANQAP